MNPVIAIGPPPSWALNKCNNWMVEYHDGGHGSLPVWQMWSKYSDFTYGVVSCYPVYKSGEYVEIEGWVEYVQRIKESYENNSSSI